MKKKTEAEKIAAASEKLEAPKLKAGVGPRQTAALVVHVGMGPPANAGKRMVIIEVGDDEIAACHEFMKVVAESKGQPFKLSNARGLQWIAIQTIREFMSRPPSPSVPS